MAHGDPEPMITLVTIILAAWMFTTIFGFAFDFSATSAIWNFFTQPSILAIFAVMLLAPRFFFQYLPGAVAMFVAGIILLISLKNGI
ncbi:hypothetical protein HY989_06120 [Candidatus Micrarchaeota archaeon]|nr:hypothetical protein [Candidatus Micrarchaeota archaeon]